VSSTGLNRLVYDLADGEDLRARDREQLFKEYGVSPEELELLERPDLRALHDRGLHPLLVCKLGFMQGLEGRDMASRLGS
jgi:hypothetical protein